MKLLATVAVLCCAAPALAAPGPSERDRRLVDTYRQMLRNDPGEDYAFRRLLEVSHAVGGLAGLIGLYEQETAEAPKRFSAWIILGHLHRAAERVDDANAAYARAMAIDPRSPVPHLARATLLRSLRKWTESFAAWDQAVALSRVRSKKQDVLRAAAETAIEADQPDRADAYFEALIATEPNNLFLAMQRAGTLARLDQVDRALAAWVDLEARARGKLEHLVTIWKEIAELQTRMGRLSEAEATWRRALEKTPRTHWARQTFLEGLVGVHRRGDRLRDLVAELEPQARRSREVLLTLARLYEELADDARALALYREAVERRPSDQRARLAALRLLERVGSPEEIIEAYLALIRSSPGEQRHELRLAELYFHHRKKKQGYALLDRISRSYPQDPGVHQRIIDLWMRYGDSSTRNKIEGEYKILMRLEPSEESHVISLGEYYWSIDDRRRAMATWQRLLRMGRSRGEGHFLLGEVYSDHEMLGKALVEFERAVSLAPDNDRFIKAYAALAERRGETDLALTQWRRILERPLRRSGPAIRDARRHIIQLWEREDRLGDEIASLERRFAAQPPDIAAGRFLATAYLHVRRLTDARRVLEQIRGLDPDDIDALVSLEQVYTRQNALTEAIGILEQLARVNSRAAVDYLHRAADLALSLGDDRLALRYAREVVERNPADPEAHARVGDLYVRMGYRAEAAQAWRQSLMLNPRNYPVRFELASLYRQMGKPIREEQVLSDIVREATEPPDALRAGRRLLQLGVATGRLEQVEDVLRPMVLSSQSRGIYLKLLVDVYVRLCQKVRYDPGLDAAARRQALKTIGERGLKPLLDALADNDVAVRSRALDVLEMTHPAGAAPALARLTQEADTLAQIQAAVTLGKIGTSTAVAALARMNFSGKRNAPEIATWALGLIPTPEAARVLGHRAQRASSSQRLMVAAALGRGRHPGGFEPAAQLAVERNQAVREVALWALGRIGDPRAVPLLKRSLDKTMAGQTRRREAETAAWSLGQIATPEAHDALVGSLWRREGVVQSALWRALAFPPEPAEDPYVNAIYDKLLNRTRPSVMQVRANLYAIRRQETPGPTALPVAQRFERRLSRRVAEILSRSDVGTVINLLDSVVSSPRLSLTPDYGQPSWSEAGRQLSLLVLGPQRDALLELAAASLGERAQGLALELLGYLAEADPETFRPDLVAALAIEALTTAGPSAKRGALAALAVLVTPESERAATAIAAWLEGNALDDAPPGTRLALASIAGRVGHHKLAPLLLSLLRDPYGAVRRAAVVAARQTGDERFVAALVDLIDDPVQTVSHQAIDALGHFDSGLGRAALKAVARYGEPRKKQAAKRALAADGGALAPN